MMWYSPVDAIVKTPARRKVQKRQAQRPGKHICPSGTSYGVCKCRMRKRLKQAERKQKQKSCGEDIPPPACEKIKLINQLVKVSENIRDVRRYQKILIKIFCNDTFMRQEIMLSMRMCQSVRNLELLRRLVVRLVPQESVVNRDQEMCLNDMLFKRLRLVTQTGHAEHGFFKKHDLHKALCRISNWRQPLQKIKLIEETMLKQEEVKEDENKFQKLPNDKNWQMILKETVKVLVMRTEKNKACNPKGCMVDYSEMAGDFYEKQCFIDDACVPRVACTSSSDIDTKPLKRISCDEWVYVPKKASINTTKKLGSCEPVPDLDHVLANVKEHGSAVGTTENKKVSCQTDTSYTDTAGVASTEPIENKSFAEDDSLKRVVIDYEVLSERSEVGHEGNDQEHLPKSVPDRSQFQKLGTQLYPEFPALKVMTRSQTKYKEHIEQSCNKHLDEQSLLKKDRKREKKDAYTAEDLINRIQRDHTWLFVEQLPPPSIDLTRVVVANVTYAGLDAILRQIALGNTPGPAITMKYELLRLCTLRNYPKTNKPYLIRLAASGFYYAADGDEVICYCCGIRRNGWIERDVPDDVHKRISPKCSFFVHNAQVNYAVPRQLDGTSIKFAFLEEIVAPSVEGEGEDQSNDNTDPVSRQLQRNGEPPVVTNNSRVSTSSLGINTSSPKHPHYAVRQVRVRSFEGWPKSSHQEPTTLAEAGFYYAGIGDCVRCFYCGVGLRHWAAEDNPWIEHARWAQTCAYLRQYKGDEFISLVQMAIRITQDEEPSAPGSQPNEEITRVLMTDAAQSVVDMGYDTRIIRRAIHNILRDTAGRTGMTAQIIMEKVLELEEEQQSVADEPTPPPTREMSQLEINKHASDPGTPGNPGNQSVPKTQGTGSQTGGAARGTGVTDLQTGKASTQPGQDPKKVKEENKKLKEQTICKICMERTVCIVFLPCGHLVTCAECAPVLRKCPICRSLVKGTVKTYIS